MSRSSGRRACSLPGRVRGCGLIGVALVGFAAGCGRDAEFVEVRGTVTLNGKPLPEVEVVFLPDSDQGNRGPRTAAYTDAQGRYRLFCDQAGRTGSVLGPARVCVIDVTAVAALDAVPGMRMLGKPPAAPGRHQDGAKAKRARIPAAYSSVAQTPLRVDIVPGRTVFDFDLPNGPRR